VTSTASWPGEFMANPREYLTDNLLLQQTILEGQQSLLPSLHEGPQRFVMRIPAQCPNWREASVPSFRLYFLLSRCASLPATRPAPRRLSRCCAPPPLPQALAYRAAASRPLLVTATHSAGWRSRRLTARF